MISTFRSTIQLKASWLLDSLENYEFALLSKNTKGCGNPPAIFKIVIGLDIPRIIVWLHNFAIVHFCFDIVHKNSPKG